MVRREAESVIVAFGYDEGKALTVEIENVDESELLTVGQAIDDLRALFQNLRRTYPSDHHRNDAGVEDVGEDRVKAHDCKAIAHVIHGMGRDRMGTLSSNGKRRESMGNCLAWGGDEGGVR